MIKVKFYLLQQLKNAGIKPKHQTLDNEATEEYKKIMKKMG